VNDEQIVHYLRGRAQMQPPIDLSASVSDAIADAPQQRATWFAPLMPAAASLGAVIVLALAVLLLNQNPDLSAPDPSASPSASPSPTASLNPLPSSTPVAIGDRLLERGDMVQMPAIDDLGEWGTIRLERGDEVRPSDSAWSTYDHGSMIIEIFVTYTAERGTDQTFGLLDWGLRVEDGVPGIVGSGILPARRDPERPVRDSLIDQASATAGSTTDGWIALEIPIVEETSGVFVTYQGGERPSGATSAPTWEVLVRERERNAPPVEGADLLEAGDATLVPAVTADGPFGMITLDRGHDAGGYPLVLDPSSTTHFFIEIHATYELDAVAEGMDFGELDWRVETDDGMIAAELLNVFPPPRGRVQLGQWPGATVPEDRYSGWLLFAVPRDAAETNLDLVYQPAGVTAATRIAVRGPGEAPAPVAPEWPYEEPVYVAQGELPFTVSESADADALFIDADTCTNPDGGYTVNYPDSWYTNTGLDNVPACSWFSPTYYELNDSGERPEEIAIEIRVFDGAVGFIWADLYSEQIRLDGFDARRAETGMTKDPETPTDQFQYSYLASLDADSEGRKVWAFTGTDYGGDYELNKAVMDRIMASLEFTD
jgi:hypothetical protein